MLTDKKLYLGQPAHLDHKKHSTRLVIVYFGITFSMSNFSVLPLGKVITRTIAISIICGGLQFY